MKAPQANSNPPKTNPARKIAEGVGYCLVLISYFVVIPWIFVGGFFLLFGLNEYVAISETTMHFVSFVSLVAGTGLCYGVAVNYTSMAAFTGDHKEGAKLPTGIFKEREIAFISTTIIVCGFSLLLAAKLAMLLQYFHLADYDTNFPGLPTFSDMAGTFLWYNLDMIPGLDITGTIKWERPVEPSGVWAGLPIIIYKIWLIYFIFSKVRLFLKNRSEKEKKVMVVPVEGDVVEG
ncbi:MAG: hypothetical protein K0Q79_3451 [Flavipsychrobacter sp.]|jgi:hypothetical protein|nr:hypothetical protein [Flavipsychrobacter sp.]